MKLFTYFLIACITCSAVASAQTPITIAGLRALAAPSTTAPYFITDVGRQGVFYYDSKDGVSADNGGTVVLSAGKRFKRMYSGAVDVRWFGMVADFNGTTGTDNTAAFNAAINGCAKGETVMVPAGEWYIAGSITMPLTTVKKVNLEIFGNVNFGKGSGFVIQGRNQDFRAYGMIVGGNKGATTEAAYNAYSGTGVYLKNAFNCRVEVNEIKDFRYGILQAGDKSGGTPDGSQYNRVFFNSIHNCQTQIRLSLIGTTSQEGNWNNETYWYGGQIGNGIPGQTFGAGGWYGIVMEKEASSNAVYPIDGHMFHDIGFEGIEKALVMKNCSGISFIGGGIEPSGSHYGFDLDPVTVTGTKFIGFTYLMESQFVAGRMGTNTSITATPIWVGSDPNKGYAGSEAVSTSGSKLLITSPKYSITNFNVNKQNDLRSATGDIPSLQAMMYRIGGVTRVVGFKSTFFHVTSATAGSPITLPLNIGLVRVEATQAKVFKIDAGDIVAFGEGFIVEYLTPQFPISFVRADNGTVLIPATSFPSAGTYKCTWAAGQYKIARLGAEYKMFTQVNSTYVIPEGIETVFVNYIYGNCTTTLPSAALWPSRQITIKNIQAAKTVQLIGVSSSDENIIPGRCAVTVKSDGATWNIVSAYKRGLSF